MNDSWNIEFAAKEVPNNIARKGDCVNNIQKKKRPRKPQFACCLPDNPMISSYSSLSGPTTWHHIWCQDDPIILSRRFPLTTRPKA